MAQGQSLEARLARLDNLKEDPFSEAAIGELRRTLSDPSNILAARAAEIIGESGLSDLAPDLAVAFDRFMEDPTKSDKQCLAKTAIAGALNDLDYEDEALFFRGIRHVQLEWMWGDPPIDTAADLRGRCGFALARLRHPDAFFELTTLLVDLEPHARRSAVSSLGCLECERSELLLRMKALTGDLEPSVVGECFSALMRISPARSLDFVAGFLDHKDPRVAEGAAIALGESRQPEAFDLLRERWEGYPDPAFRKMLLLPIALFRSDEALDFLLGVVAQGPPALAARAVESLKLYRNDDDRRARIRRAIIDQDDATVSAAYEREFGPLT